MKVSNRFVQAEDQLLGCNWPRAASGSLSEVNPCLSFVIVSYFIEFPFSKMLEENVSSTW